MRYLVLACALLLQEGRGRDVLFEEGRAIPVRPAVSTADRHSSCVVVFPEESIESLVAAWTESDISIERKNNLLFLKLLRPVEGDLHVVGASGTLYRLAIKPGEDTSVRIHRPLKQDRDGSPALDFIRTMRMGRAPADCPVKRGGDAVLYRIGATEARCRWVYEGNSYTGFVLEVRNLGDAPHRIDPSVLHADRLILIGARDFIVAAHESTLVYLVFARNP